MTPPLKPTCSGAHYAGCSTDLGSQSQWDNWEGMPRFQGGDCKRHDLWQLPAARRSRLPVSGSHWCSQGSRSRRAQRSMAHGPLEFCWEKRTTWAGFSQSLASSWLPSSKMKRLPAGEREEASCVCTQQIKTYKHTQAHTQIEQTHTQRNKHTEAHTKINTHIHTQNIHIHIEVHTHKLTYTHKHTQETHTCMQAHTKKYIHTLCRLAPVQGHSSYLSGPSGVVPKKGTSR